MEIIDQKVVKKVTADKLMDGENSDDHIGENVIVDTINNFVSILNANLTTHEFVY